VAATAARGEKYEIDQECPHAVLLTQAPCHEQRCAAGRDFTDIQGL
jgi:hypothetical protein